MAKISGFIYLLLGAAVSIASFIIDKDKMKIFIFVGYFFIAIGTAKILSNYVFAKETKEEKKDFEKQESVLDKIKKEQFDPYGFVSSCPRCHTPMRKINLYCHRCGMKQ